MGDVPTGNAATIDPEIWNKASEPKDTRPRCQNCSAPKDPKDAVCRRCGFYPALGRVVELGDEDREDQPKVAPPTFCQVWIHLVPLWAWGVAAAVLAVIAESVAVAVVLPHGSLRTLWSFSQLLLGFTALVIVHLMAYVSSLMENASANLLDIVLKPVDCWSPVVKQLPKTWKRIAVAVSALTAIIMSLAVIRGLDYEKLLDWGIEKQTQPNLLGAVIDQAKKIGPKDQTMDEALDALAEKVEDLDKEPEKPRINVECVVIGYTVTKNQPDNFASLIVAANVDGKLKVVGYISDGFPPETRGGIMSRLKALQQPQPFVEVSVPNARWVAPRVTCRVSCIKQAKDGQLEEPKFETLLAELKL